MQYYALQFAALISKSEIGLPGPKSETGIIRGILLPVYFWAGVLAVIVIIAAGFFYVTSNGDSSRIARAKNAILASVIGLVVILMAFGITNMVLGGVS